MRKTLERVMIVGGPGSGKSTLATRRGDVTGLPVFHTDNIHYLPDWVERTKAQKSVLTQEVHARKTWIFEGGHSATYTERAARADFFIWLDIPVWTRLHRVLRRSCIHPGKSRPDMPAGCPEKFNRQTKEDVLRAVINFSPGLTHQANLVTGTTSQKVIVL